MMKGPGIKEYLDYLNNLKQTAHNEGKKYIDVSSRDIHSVISKETSTMPTCCQAIYKLMLTGDEILESPRGHTGFGSRLLVRYYVDQLEGKSKLFPDKKRGRPAKSEEERSKNLSLNKQYSDSDLKSIITLWLNERGWDVKDDKDYLKATKDNLLWIVSIQGSRRGRRAPLPERLNTILSDIADEASYYSIAFNDLSDYRKQWSEVPKIMKTKLKVSLLFADKKGKVFQYK